MLMAAGMDAQDVENKLLADVNEARKALLNKEVDPTQNEELRMMWRQAKEVLDSFRMTQVAGGECSNQGCRDCPARHAAAGGAPCGRRCPGACHQGWRRPSSLGMQVMSALALFTKVIVA